MDGSALPSTAATSIPAGGTMTVELAPPRPTRLLTAVPPQRPAGRGTRLRWLVILGVPALAFGILASVLRQQPAFYVERLTFADGAEKRRLSNEFLKSVFQLHNDILHERSWGQGFTEAQLNGWLAEDFQINHAELSLPPGVSLPRVAFDAERARVGFRYTKGPFSVIVHTTFRVWTPQPNTLVLELLGAWAGDLPLPATYVRQVVERIADAYNLSVAWRRLGPNLAAVLEFSRSQRDLVLQRVEIQEGAIRISGISGSATY